MTSEVRIVAIDDEPLALRRLEILLARFSDVALVGSARTLSEGVALTRRLRPDVLLVDVEMPERSGLDVVAMLAADELPAVVFVTAYDRYAVDAFERNAIDYVLKPVQIQRLRKAIDRAAGAQDLARRAAQADRLAALDRGERGEPPAVAGRSRERDVWVPHQGGMVRVPFDAIEWVEAERDYVRLHTPAASYLLRETMKTIEERLDPSGFARVHRSALVRVSAVRWFRRRATGVVVAGLDSGAEVHIGRAYLRNFTAIVETLRR